MPRKLLLFAAIAVAGSMLALWLVTRKTAASSPTDTTYETRDPKTTAPEGNRTLPPRLDPSDPNRPTSGQVAQVERGANADKVTEPPLEYTLPDGRKVRDFRDPANRKPLDVPPSIHPPGGRKIKPELTGLFTDQILAQMRECGKSVPKEMLGEKPRLEGQIVIAIKNGEGSVTSAVFKLTNINSESLADSTKQCVEQKSLLVKVPAADETDLDAYSINLSFAFP